MKRRIILTSEGWPDLAAFPLVEEPVRYAPITMSQANGPVTSLRVGTRVARTEPDLATQLTVNVWGALGDLRSPVSQALANLAAITLVAFPSGNPTVQGATLQQLDEIAFVDFTSMVVDLLEVGANLTVFILMVDISWTEEDGPPVAGTGASVTVEWPDPLPDDFGAANMPVVHQWIVGSGGLTPPMEAALDDEVVTDTIPEFSSATAVAARLTAVGGAPTPWGAALYQVDRFDPAVGGWVYTGLWGIVPAGARRVPADYFTAAMLADLGGCSPWAMWPEALQANAVAIPPTRLLRLRSSDISGRAAAVGASYSLQLQLGA